MQNEAIALMTGCILVLLAVAILAVAGFFGLLLIPSRALRLLWFICLPIGFVISC